MLAVSQKRDIKGITMGMKDSILKFFHLSDDDYDEDFDDYDDYEDDIYEEKKSSKKDKKVIEEPKIDYSVKPASKVKQNETNKTKFTQKSGGKVIQMRRDNLFMEVCVIKPTMFNDAREITDTLLSGKPVIINLEGLQENIAQRIIDFASGTAYAIDGKFQVVTNSIFIATPENVDISGDLQEMLSGNFDVAKFE